MRFIGNIEAKTDSKGRVFLPACFRRILQTAECEKVMLRKDVYQDCLVLYPEKSWNEQLDLLRSRLDKWNVRHQMIFRTFVADVEELSIDSNGRILLPKRYRDMVNIAQEVRFIGMDDTIEIWAKEKLSQPFMSAEEFSKELESIMTEKKGGSNE
ncbi:MAG: division/cell wall cluster transcriptional repressor MraZ [Bacteroidaceae bacterium]|nr:division/cell wall cluster transcriptional repressor MraZ [Bacteroidales bacterium]MBQ2878929.1 division/cell wall cluster transcriptional repressor MraZ [Bacteroidaceae bacterium]MBQ3189133.1 division/cell wall cluster transcriptional repressor MraZ [Bacteroidaceae bacterium]MBQ3622623.1 division/cell wall cluster transcriptional repressor MraZ [Bacteroidaceae bacterium]MBR7135333.1 division/cell wall cluster transcriptional repressor MraZ [Bacteroidaceae bacterium]